jgi:hypothetical protein
VALLPESQAQALTDEAGRTGYQTGRRPSHY